MLILVGLGVCGDITKEGLEVVKKADIVYAEFYTLPFPKDTRDALLRKYKPTVLERRDVESNRLINEAKNKNVVLLVGGDPLTATTHISLINEAEKIGIPTRIIHNSSIITVAAGITGLQIYKFGRIATLVNHRENYKPMSALNIISENKRLGMHTLVLLDTEPEPLDIKNALNMLREFGNCVIISQGGCKHQKVYYGNIDTLLKNTHKLGNPPFCIVIPGKLHFLEEECLNRFRL